MADSTIQQIKDRLGIVELVSSYLKLEKTGINWRAPCPFHAEKKPSFFVSPARQSFKCFGCGVSGSIFDFVMQIEGIEFGDALRLLAKRTGVELKKFNPELQTKRQRLYQICEIACKFFEKQLESSQTGKAVNQYLLDRGISQDSIKKFRLGYAPDQWRALSDFLVGRGYNREEVINAGLAVKSEKNKTPYDRFRGRIIFPVFDLHSQVIGFGGRVFVKSFGNAQKAEETAKYLNTPNTLLYDKSRVLYGLNFGKMDVRKKESCILTEGYTDVILSHQAGFLNTVASSGIALTPFQLSILKRYSPNLLTAFDMDVAGDMATKRGIDLALEADFDVKVINMPAGKDPADVIAENPKHWQKLIDKAQSIMDFYFDSALAKFDKKSPEGKKEISKILLPKLKQLPNKIVQAHWAQKLAETIKIKEEAVFDELKKVVFKKTADFSSHSAPPASAGFELKKQPAARRALLEDRILALAVKQPQLLESISSSVLECLSPQTKSIFFALKKADFSDKNKFDKALKKLEKNDEAVRKVFDRCFLEIDSDVSEKPEEEMSLCVSRLKHFYLKDKMENMALQIQEAEQSADQQKLKTLIAEFNKLAKTAK